MKLTHSQANFQNSLRYKLRSFPWYGHNFETFGKIFCRQIFPECPLNLLESATLVLALKVKYNLSRSCVNAILQLIKLHLPRLTKFPETEVQAEKEISKSETGQMRSRNDYFYCKDCLEVLDEVMTCKVCNKIYKKDRSMYNNYIFTILDIRSQIESLLGIEDVAIEVESMIQKRRSQPPHLKKQLQKIPLKNFDLTLCLNTDGVPIFNSSKTAIWPVLLALNELPMHLKSRYVMLAGLWVGKGKIVPDLVFPFVVKQLNSLQQNPVQWKLANKEKVMSHVFVISVAVDAPARCIVQGHTQFNGEFGCNWCEQQGEVVPKGRGYARVYVYNPGRLRTNDRYKQQVVARHFTLGIQTASPLLLLQNFDIVKGLSVDHMHCSLLGIARTFLSIWMKSSMQQVCIAKSIDAINNRWTSMRVPDELPRTPRSLHERKYWKASELKTWLFSTTVILNGILPDAYLDHHKKLVVALHKLLSTNITEQDLKFSSESLVEYVKGVESLYGKEFCTFNVHQLAHIAECVEELGYLWENSAFIFENFNGILKKCVNSSNGILAQICKKFLRNFVLASEYKYFESKEVQQFIRENLLIQNNSEKKLEIHGPFSPPKGYEEVFKDFREKFPVLTTVCASKKCSIGRRTLKCSKTDRKRVNNIVLLDSGTIAKVICFLKCKCACNVACDCQHDFALIEKSEVVAMENCPYVFCKRPFYASQVVVIDLKKLTAEKLCVAEFDGREHFVSMPNLFEFE